MTVYKTAKMRTLNDLANEYAKLDVGQRKRMLADIEILLETYSNSGALSRLGVGRALRALQWIDDGLHNLHERFQ